ncbi:glutathione-disulfide reductase [Pseudochrobactrum sp. sp1633]|uniref:glutathione-disulfide reductase n=1 Tax=Pseudochrobactrum sp. sp1633 TaxID=3036706 RepID=UPI0025A5F40E|nr:glutathione-disulfide reductase [Pseudochrobactrum sp. sp1633]MDM8344665.1 glutathione-disulfide reductase [Pseudochrobactrum sp. sp1633]HWD13575.1 glutathione-disulfide reductase [Pseudochrobactrum sp.]
MTSYDYDLFVIGGGSGGVRAGRLAGAMGKKVGLAEEYRMGGTCVIRGCVPKKLYVYASQFPEHFSDAAGYGWTVGERSFDWSKLVANKEAEITRLEGLYAKGLNNAKTEIFASRAVLKDAHTIELTGLGKSVTAETILIATGGHPFMDDAMPGHELCINSDQVFDLAELPKSIVIQGGGYIAVEFAGIFNGLGVETTLVYRGKQILKSFDSDAFRLVTDAMIEKGIRIVTEAKIDAVAEGEDDHRLSVTLSTGEVLAADQVLQAIGRVPNTKGLGLENAGVKQAADGSVIVDEYSHTNIENIWAVGDVTNRVQLTPVAIHEAMCFLETAFKGNPVRPDHELIPTAVFSQPEIGTVGLSEEDAAKQYANVEVYRALFRPMRNTLAGRSDKMLTKLVVDGDSRKVLGAHVVGPDAGEMAQLLGIALKASATKDDFDRTMALHPSAAEEFVTMYTPSYRLVNGVRQG